MPLEDPTIAPAPLTPRRRALRAFLFLLVVPALLLGPIVVAGERFLPYLPRGHEPLRSEDPAAGATAFDGANFAQADRIFPVLTDQLAMKTELRQGRLPTWQPRQGLGAPLFAGTIAGAAYPPNWLAFLMPPEYAAGPLALLSLFLAGLGVWLLLRRLGLSVGACVVGVLGMQLGGWGIAHLFLFMKLDAALWIPWALWAVEGIARGKRGSGIALTLSLACSLVAGFVPLAIFGLAIVGAYALFRLVPLPRILLGEDMTEKEGFAPSPVEAPRVLLAAGFALLGLLVASIQLLPSFEASRQSRRVDVDASMLVDQSLPSTAILGAVIPDFVGSPTDLTPPGGLPIAWWMTPAEDSFKAEKANSLEWTTYAGVVIVLLALTALLANPRRAAFPALALLAVLGFAFAWPGAHLLYRLPGLNIGDPGRILALAWFLWPWLAAWGAEAMIRRGGRAVEIFLVLSFLFTAGAFFVWNGFEPERWAQQFETTMVERYVDVPGSAYTLDDIRARVPPAEAVRAGEHLQVSFAHCFAAGLGALLAAGLAFLFDRGRRAAAGKAPRWILGAGLVVLTACAIAPLGDRGFSEEFGTPTALLAAGGVVFLALLWWRPGSRSQPGLWLPLAAAVAIEGLLATAGHVSGRPPLREDLFPASEAIEAVREAAGDGRVWRFDESESGIADGVELARPNLLEAYGISDLTPYVVFTSRTLIELVIAIEPGVYTPSSYLTFCSGLRREEDIDHPILDILRVEAVLSRRPLDHPRLRPVLSRPGFHVYHRSGALPAARIVPQAVASTTNEAALSILHQRVLDPALATVLAPEHSELAAPVDPPADWEAGTIETVRRPAGNRMEYVIWGSGGGWLVMHEQFYPGWHAEVNGEEVPLLRADHACRAVRIPAGDCEVVVRYAPGSWRLGTILCLAALATAALLTGRYRL